ncbi:nucleolar protein of 40 kDa [Latimeria chalumnae]|uniref:nucleolar protein of 40 kDa n=1 Tax=Latimeria chalumnae TaxID=7897 RepID=UPI0006D91B27|nr:PREDICTED: nucleolar protein of 40 kDa [Latimeria chalumnae]|eukprot:XP_005993193.2 PREDICTED: nucleolar protein of 40 kDa [Latimeria chalumnae]
MMEDLPDLYSIFQGEVASVTEYGAFVKVPGCRRQGLVHKSHMSSCRVDKPSEIVDVGEQVWVKVIGKEKTDEKVKLSLSMKVVNQGTGKDLDPNNVTLEQDERKKREFKDYTGQRITLEAVLNTICKKCGCKGHFAKDCFTQPGGTKYSLLPEEEEEEKEKEEREAAEPPSQPEKSAKRKKKEKKKKKSKRKRSSSEAESSDASCSEEQHSGSKRRKTSEKSSKSHKRKKHHKQKERA